ncbi:MAG: helix-turn-helix transcriptional regulator [Oscillospiraceae bacterium]|nr:helix-turn-helix transcriptional regulator [Oscillospiraceae bacterium]
MSTLDKIIKLLAEKNIQQKELCDYIGVSANVFTNWKLGQNKSYLKHISKIAEFLGVSADYLLGTDKKTSPPSEEDELTAEAIRLFKMLPDDKKRAFLALMDDFGKK